MDGYISRRGALGAIGSIGIILAGKAAGISALEWIAGGEAEASQAKKNVPAAKQILKSARQPPRFRMPESPDVFITRDYQIPDSREYWSHLEKGALEFLQERYGSEPFWGKKRINDVDIEKRIHNILVWIRKGAQEKAGIYPTDPLLIVAQIYEESRFYEFSISPVCAAGIAQFIKPSAKAYGMLCAGKKNNNGCRVPSLASEYEQFLDARGKRRHMREAVLDPEDLPLMYLDIKRMTDKEKLHLARYKNFLQANVEGRDIFNPKDIAFINQFDQRFGYRHAIPAMVAYMAGNLRSSDGYVPSALIGYNAGMGHVNKKKGRMPHIWPSVKYAENILFTYRAIAQHANG